MNINIPATKTNLLKFKTTLSLAKEGYELLDQKRRIILNEIENLLNVVDRFKKDLETALKNAYNLLDRAIVSMGESRIREVALSIDTKNEISISKNRIVGIDVFLINLKIIENLPYFSPIGINLYLEEVILKFKNVLFLITSLTEKKYMLLYLAKELQKTIRKINALEKVHIPFYEEALKYITNKLDEQMMENFSILKLIKIKLKT